MNKKRDISRRVQKMDTSGIRRVFARAAAVKDPIDLSIGQPDFTVPEMIKTEACAAIMADRNRYAQTFGIDALRDAVVEKIKKKNGMHVQREQIMITTAVSGGLSIALPCVIDPGDEVIIFDPCFVGYRQLIMLYGGVPISVRKKDDFSIDFDALAKNITPRTRVIIFNSPENPTGHVSDRSEIEQLVACAKKHDLWIFSDEIYEDFVYDGDHVSIGSLYQKTVTFWGFSKSHAMTGWRVGYLCAPQELAHEIEKVQQYTFVCAPVPFQYAAVAAIHSDLSEYVTAYKKKRDMVYEGLREHYTIVRSHGAFYFFISYPYDAARFISQCEKHDLLIVPGHVFSAHDTHFRISFATSDAQLRKAIKILQKIAVCA